MERVLKTFEINLDAKQSISNPPFTVVDGDNGNILRITLTDDGLPVNMLDCFVMAVFSKPDGRTAEQDNDGHGLTVTGEENNIIEIALYLSSISPGLVECEIQVYSDLNMDTLITTARFNFNCRRAIMNGNTLPKTDEWPVLVDMIKRIEGAEEELADLNVETREAAADANAAADRANNIAEAVEVAEAQRVVNEAKRIENENKREAFIYGMSASALTLPPGSPAWAHVDSSGESAKIQFGIPTGKDGRDAVNVSVEGFFYLYITELGDLHVVVADGMPPPLYINEAGELIYSIA